MLSVSFSYYQVRAGVKCAPRIQSTTKVELKSECPSPFGIDLSRSKGLVLINWSLDDSNDQIYPACVFNEWGVSKTFLIIYKNEEVQLDDQINFKLSVIVDAQNVRRAGESVLRHLDRSRPLRLLNASIAWICSYSSNFISSKKTIRTYCSETKISSIASAQRDSDFAIRLDRKRCRPCNNYVVDVLNYISTLVLVFTLTCQYSSIIFIYQL